MNGFKIQHPLAFFIIATLCGVVAVFSVPPVVSPALLKIRGQCSPCIPQTLTGPLPPRRQGA